MVTGTAGATVPITVLDEANAVVSGVTIAWTGLPAGSAGGTTNASGQASVTLPAAAGGYTLTATKSAITANQAVTVNSAIGFAVGTSALRVSEWSGGARIERVRLTNGGNPVVGAVIACLTEDASNVSTSSPSAATDANGYAAFLVNFNSGGRSLLTFTHAASGSIGYLLAISRTLADS